MYDWPETRAETDEEWVGIRDSLRARGVSAPDSLTRRNADLPPVPGGIRDFHGQTIAPDPATLPPDDLDVHTLWVHPQLLFAKTCWGPMEQGLAGRVRVIGQPSYDAYDGGQGELYSSAIVMRRDLLCHERGKGKGKPARSATPAIPLDLLRGKRLAYNSLDSMSGIIALGRDLEAMGAGLGIFSERIETGAHRASVAAVAEGRADVCAIDCRSWAMVKRFKDVSRVDVAGWTGKRKGLPYITAAGTPDNVAGILRAAISRSTQGMGMRLSI
jgi:ABC-type phosphate/phosphonate transport system substrate-binding protein